MDQSFYSDSTFCSFIEDNENEKREIPNELSIQYIFDKIQSHLQGKHLLGNVIILKYMKAISKIKARALDGKKTVASLEKILQHVYNKNTMFRDKSINYDKLGRPTNQQDLTINSFVQDGKIQDSAKHCLEPFQLECMNNEESLSFKTNMLSNQHFISSYSNSENNIGESNATLDKALTSHTLFPPQASIKDILHYDQTISAPDSTNNIISRPMQLKTSTKSRISCEMHKNPNGMTKDSNSKDIVGENNKSIEDLLKNVTKYSSSWMNLSNTSIQSNYVNQQSSFLKSVKYEECQQYYDMLGETIEKQLVPQLISEDLGELQIRTSLQQSIATCQEISRNFQERRLINASSNSLAEEELVDFSHLDWRII